MRYTIDPGHGGHDSGAVGANPACPPEKVLVLEVSTLLAEGLRNAGHEVMETRVDDTFVELGDRAAMANDYGADRFISIHFNSADSNAATGIETFHYPGSESGAAIATPVQAALMAEFSVLVNTSMPAILVECEFISNVDMHRKVSQPGSWVRFANAIMKGLGVPVEEVPMPPLTVCPTCGQPLT